MKQVDLVRVDRQREQGERGDDGDVGDGHDLNEEKARAGPTSHAHEEREDGRTGPDEEEVLVRDLTPPPPSQPVSAPGSGRTRSRSGP